MDDVVVIGAGIGGLTAALCLHRAGHRVTVVEQVRRVAPLGVGINLQPPAVGVLTAVGLGAWLAERGVATSENVYLDPHGTHLFTEPRGLRRGHLWPQYAVHRGELQTALLDRVAELCGPGTVRFGTRVTGIDTDGGDARVTVTDRDTGEVSVLAGQVVVGADGLHSAVRAALHPGDGPLLHSGTVMWRGTTAAPEFLDGRSMVLVQGGDGSALVAYPIHHPAHGPDTVVNWVLQLPVGERGPVRPADVGWNRAGRAEDLLPRVRDWDLGVLDVAGLVTGAEAVLEFPMVDKDPLTRWGDGRAVTLLGDAAHPMYPVGANGATQAILDATALTEALGSPGDGDTATALGRYEAARIAPTRAIVEANREMHRAEHAAGDGIRAVTDRYREALGGQV